VPVRGDRRRSGWGSLQIAFFATRRAHHRREAVISRSSRPRAESRRQGSSLCCITPVRHIPFPRRDIVKNSVGCYRIQISGSKLCSQQPVVIGVGQDSWPHSRTEEGCRQDARARPGGQVDHCLIMMGATGYRGSCGRCCIAVVHSPRPLRAWHSITVSTARSRCIPSQVLRLKSTAPGLGSWARAFHTVQGGGKSGARRSRNWAKALGDGRFPDQATSEVDASDCGRDGNNAMRAAGLSV